MNDLISRSALIRDVEVREIVVHSNEHPFDAMRKQGKAFRDCVDNAIAVDAVEVVRCRDCKYFKKMSDGYTKCSHKYGLAMVLLNTYCSRGERKENEID